MSKDTILRRQKNSLDAAKAVTAAAAAGNDYPSTKVSLAMIEDLASFTSGWSDYLKVRQTEVGPMAAGMDAALQLLGHAEVSAQVQSSDSYDRGDYFGPFKMQGETYLAGDPLLLGTNGSVHSLYRDFIWRVSPAVATLGSRMGEIAIDVLAPANKAGKLDTAEPLQRATMDMLHRLYLREVLSPLNLRSAISYANMLFITAFPIGLQVIPFGPAVLGQADYKRRAVGRYLKSPGFGRIKEVADDLGIKPKDAAGNLMLALHLASMPATSALIASVMGELVRHPTLLNRVRAEYDEVRVDDAPGAPLTQAQVDRATVVEKVIHETGRMHPPVQWTNSVLRQDKTVKIGSESARFTKGSRVMASIATANMDPAVFAKPEVFDIERDHSKVMTWNGSQDTNNHRDCVGKPIAMSMVKTFVLTLVGRYVWKDVDPGSVRWETEKLSVVRPEGLILKKLLPRAGV